jgi:predicted permease
MGIPLVAGREFTENDDARHPVVVIINEHLAKLVWPNRDPVGQTIKVFGSETPVEIVGVVKDVTFDNIGEDPAPYIFFSIAQETDRGGFGTLQVRTQGDATLLVQTIRKEIQALDNSLPLVNVTTMEEAIRQGLWASRTGAALLSIFGLLALLLAAIGVYGIMSYTVGKRTREIGIRMAIGAQRGDVLQLILNQGLLIAGLGLLTGLGAAFLAARYFQNFLLGIGAGDALTYAAITLILSTVALVACLLPALRATKVDPLIALRTE